MTDKTTQPPRFTEEEIREYRADPETSNLGGCIALALLHERAARDEMGERADDLMHAPGNQADAATRVARRRLLQSLTTWKAERGRDAGR